MDGVLVVDKPAGITSHDVVANLRRLTGEKKVGHTGTLDPLATGVLVLCFGGATKAAPYLPEGNKTYAVEAMLGLATETQDRLGRVVDEQPDCQVPHEELERALAGFLGSGTQLPPMYSAVKIGGERLYRLARAGLVVERHERPISICGIRLDWPCPSDRPVFHHGDCFGFTVTGSKGLYVRTLCHDLGQKLGCGAHLRELRRMASGPFHIGQAAALADLSKDNWGSLLLTLDKALAHLPAVSLDAEATRRASHGNPIRAALADETELARAVDPTGRTFAILERRQEEWQPIRVFNQD